MPLGLRPQVKVPLKAALLPILDEAIVHSRKFLDYSIKERLQGLDALLPKTGPIREKLRTYISDEPMSDFVYGQLSHDLEAQAYEGDQIGLLSGVAGFEDSAAVASRLVEALDALPKRYTLSIRLPAGLTHLFNDGEVSFEVDNGVFVRKGAALQGTYQNGQELGLMGLPYSREWEADSAYLQVEFDGFFGRYVTTESHAEAMEWVFAFLGAALAIGTLTVERTWPSRPNKWSILTHESASTQWSYLESKQIKDSRANLLSSLAIGNQHGVSTPDGYRAWLRRRFTSIGYLYGAPEKTRNRLLLGCKWLFDSYCESDQLLQYIQATVVVETLLGDRTTSDQVGLGALLGNRCAYLIGHTSTQRDELLDDFRDIYDVRSGIVHRGKSRLTRRESELFYKLQWIGGRIIQREIELLERDRRA